MAGGRPTFSGAKGKTFTREWWLTMNTRREAVWLRRAVLAFGFIVVLPALGSLISRLDLQSLLILGVSLAYILLVSNVANPPAQTAHGDVNALTAKLDAMRDELKSEIAGLSETVQAATERAPATENPKDWRSEKPSPKLQAAIDHLRRNPEDAKLSTRALGAKLGVSRHTAHQAKQML